MIEYKGNKTVQPEEGKREKALWEEYVDTDTNRSSYQEHTPKLIQEFCKNDEHYFVAISPTARTVVCDKCNFITSYVLGLQMLTDGKIITK